MRVNSPEDYRLGSYLARLGEGGAPWEKELAAQAIGEAFGAGYGELVLESILWPDEAAQGTHNSASTFKTTGDVAGALRHAPAFSITSTDVTTLAHMPVTHNTLYKDTYRKAGQRYESGEEDSGFEDGSGDDTSDGRMSPETGEELPTGGPSVQRPAGKKQLKRKAKPKIPPADTGGRDAEPMSAGTPADLPLVAA